MIDAKILEGRRRVVAILDELRSVGLLRYKLTPPEIDGPEPHLDVWADREALNLCAYGMGVSHEAAYVWDLLCAGTFRVAPPSLQALFNVIDTRNKAS